jgi:hypothetical protein
VELTINVKRNVRHVKIFVSKNWVINLNIYAKIRLMNANTNVYIMNFVKMNVRRRMVMKEIIYVKMIMIVEKNVNIVLIIANLKAMNYMKNTYASLIKNVHINVFCATKIVQMKIMITMIKLLQFKRIK